MIQKIRHTILLTFTTLAIGFLLAAPALAVDPLKASCKASGGGNSSEVCKPAGSLFGSNSIWGNVVNTLIFIVGAAAVVAIIIGGLYYITAAGDDSQIRQAKNTILYAVIGLIVAVAAGGIVNFVLGRL